MDRVLEEAGRHLAAHHGMRITFVEAGRPVARHLVQMCATKPNSAAAASSSSSFEEEHFVCCQGSVAVRLRSGPGFKVDDDEVRNWEEHARQAAEAAEAAKRPPTG